MSEMKKIPSFGGFEGQNATEKNVSWSTKFGNMTAKMALQAGKTADMEKNAGIPKLLAKRGKNARMVKNWTF